MTLKRRLLVGAGSFVIVGLLLLTFVAPDFTLHRRAALTAYTKWRNNPTSETKASWDREAARNVTIQLEISAVGSLLICGLLFGSWAGLHHIMARKED
jgi:hypothetical protein